MKGNTAHRVARCVQNAKIETTDAELIKIAQQLGCKNPLNSWSGDLIASGMAQIEGIVSVDSHIYCPCAFAFNALLHKSQKSGDIANVIPVRVREPNPDDLSMVIFGDLDHMLSAAQRSVHDHHLLSLGIDESVGVGLKRATGECLDDHAKSAVIEKSAIAFNDLLYLRVELALERTRTSNRPVRSRVLYPLSYQCAAARVNECSQSVVFSQHRQSPLQSEGGISPCQDR